MASSSSHTTSHKFDDFRLDLRKLRKDLQLSFDLSTNDSDSDSDFNFKTRETGRNVESLILTASGGKTIATFTTKLIRQLCIGIFRFTLNGAAVTFRRFTAAPFKMEQKIRLRSCWRKMSTFAIILLSFLKTVLLCHFGFRCSSNSI